MHQRQALLAAIGRARAPQNLLGRLRWSFLAFGWFFILTFVPQLALGSDRPPGLRMLATLLLFALGAWWTRCYRREHFPWGGQPLEAATFLATGLAVDDPFKSLGLLYIAVNFRALYGTWRQVAGYTALALGAFLGVVLLAAYDGAPDRLPQFLQASPGLPVLAAIAHLVAVACQRGERATARERLLARTGIALALAPHPEQIRLEAQAAGTALLQPEPGSATRLTVLLRGEPPPSDDAGRVVAMEVDGDVLGHLVVEGPAPLLEEAHDSLQALAAHIGLRLLNAELTEDLRRRATHDPLTGLPNRSCFTSRAADALRSAQRSGSPFSVLLLDLDGFKQVNDRLGHRAGDEVLVLVARRLRDSLPDDAQAFRFGGDEFLVLAAAGHARAQELSERLQRALAPVACIAGEQVGVGASIGSATWTPSADVDQLLAAADAAMYEAKRSLSSVRLRSSSDDPEARERPHPLRLPAGA